jgi:hypothetical protein
LFFTFRNIGFSLSLTLALALAAGSLPPGEAVRIFLGVHTTVTALAAHALISSVRFAFRWFAASFAIAFVVALPILFLGGRRGAVRGGGAVDASAAEAP